MDWTPSEATRAIRTVAPAVPLLTVAEAREHLELPDDHPPDSYLSALVSAGTAHLDGIDGVLGRALITQTWQQSFRRFHARMLLPLAPVQSVASVTYIDTAGQSQTVDAAVWRLTQGKAGPYVERVDGRSWPSVDHRDAAVTITFVAGYGDAASDVPEAIRQALRLFLGAWHQNRGAVTDAQRYRLPYGARSLLAPYRRRTFS